VRLKRPIFLAGAILFPLLIGATSPHLVDQLRTVTLAVASPLLEFQNYTNQLLKTTLTSFAEWPRLRQENRALRAELQKRKAALVGYEEMKREKERLGALLQLKETSHTNGRAARVLARDPSHWSRFIMINKGSHDGVRKNTILVHPDGLVGKVIASGSRSARAILLIDGESRVSAFNQRTRDVGLIEGRGSSLLKMTYLDHQSDVQVGDVIISSGLGGIYPKGIPIGKVITVSEEKDHLSLYVLVKPFVSFAKLEEVLCLPSLPND